MFSGIIEQVLKVKHAERKKGNMDITLECPFTDELKIDQSIAHNGVCLTVVALDDESYTVTAIQETIDKTNIGVLDVDDKVNIERSMVLNGRLDGHIVQGHVDQTAECVSIKEEDGSWVFTFKYAFSKDMLKQGYTTVEKGSITVNGVSLTVVNSKKDGFSVAMIPYTFENTSFHTLKIGDKVNIEFDIIGKYLSKMLTPFTGNNE